MKKLVSLALLAAALLLPGLASAADITVFAAASMKESLDEVAANYQRTSGDKVVVSYAASSALARQIENGAPADLFISADLEWMDYLQERKLIDVASRRTLLGNRLVLVGPASGNETLDIAPNFPLAEKLGDAKLAMANPDAVPAGKYGKAALEKLGVWSAVEPKVARAANVRAALLLVARGEAPYGIVYRTDALAEPKVRVVGTFPEGSHAPVVYPAALVATSAKPQPDAAARRFADYLHSAAAVPVWKKYGFAVLD